jgi:hypothetical protein
VAGWQLALDAQPCPARNEQGEVLAWYGIISDVTTEHELALRGAGAAAAERSVQRLT